MTMIARRRAGRRFLVEGLGGEEDLIERLDMYAALGMTPPPDTPTSEAFLPAEDAARSTTTCSTSWTTPSSPI
jgi:hypothetical protein